MRIDFLPLWMASYFLCFSQAAQGRYHYNYISSKKQYSKLFPRDCLEAGECPWQNDGSIIHHLGLYLIRSYCNSLLQSWAISALPWPYENRQMFSCHSFPHFMETKLGKFKKIHELVNMNCFFKRPLVVFP